MITRTALSVLIPLALLMSCQAKTTAGVVDAKTDAKTLMSGVAWDRSNDPSILLSTYQRNIRALPQSGTAAAKPWSDTYWPSHEGGAAFRWQLKSLGQTVTNPYYYQLMAPDQFSTLTDSQIAGLSPAEKYDIIQGRFDYPTVQQEISRTNPSQLKWYGLCHAVAMANTNFREPVGATFQVQTSDGQTRNVPLFSSDVKALLAMALDQTTRGATNIGTVGQKCMMNGAGASSGACWDTNPASFYIALTNMIGIYRESLIMDVDPGAEVWNATAWTYSANITAIQGIGSRAAYGTVREVQVDLSLQHTIGLQPSQRATGGAYKTEKYSFTLELDENDDIIGGEWISKNRPDFVWAFHSPRQLGGYYSTLDQLLQPLR